MIDLNADQVFELATDMETAAAAAAPKARNILRRAGAEIREAWHESAREFPSKTLARREHYDISFDMRGTNANGAIVTVGSPDPLLAVIEYGSVNHSPHLYGSKALEAAVPGVEKALSWIDGVTTK